MKNIESLVLRSVIQYSDELPLFFQTLKKEFFSDEAQIVYECLWEAFSNRVHIEMQYIAQKIEKQEIILSLLEQIPTKHIQQYYNILLDDYNIMRRVELMGELQKVHGKRYVDLVGIFNDFMPKTATKYMTLKQRLKYIEDNKIKFEKYELGVNFLDIVLHGGIELHKLVLISGEYEAGKTSLCLQIIRNLAKTQKCAYFCFEFPADKYAIDENKILQRMLMSNQLKPDELEAIQNNIYIIDEGMNVDDTAANILFLASCGVKFFVIDSQMRLNVEQSLNVEESESKKFKILNNLCNKYSIVIFLIVQTSKNDTKSPSGSKKGGHEASIMIRIEHNKSKDNDTPFDPHTRSVIIQKNKQTGKHAKFNVSFDITNQTFHSNEVVEYEDYAKKDSKETQMILPEVSQQIIVENTINLPLI